MSEPHDEYSAVPSTPNGQDAVRLELTPDFPRTGFVDGGWWPRTRDLRAELPGLVAAIDARIGRRVGQVLRIGFGRKEWNPTGKQRLVTPTGRIAFSGWEEFDADLVWMSSRSTSPSAVGQPHRVDHRASTSPATTGPKDTP